MSEDSTGADVSPEFLHSLGLLLSDYPTRTLNDSDPVTLRAAAMRGGSAQQARDLVMHELTDLLSDSNLDDGYLIAAGWLLGVRSVALTDIKRDTRLGDDSHFVRRLNQAIPKQKKSFYREAAYYVLRNRTDRWSSDELEEPRTGFQTKDGKVGPRARDIASAVAPELLRRLKHFDAAPDRSPGDPGAEAVGPGGGSSPKRISTAGVILIGITAVSAAGIGAVAWVSTRSPEPSTPVSGAVSSPSAASTNLASPPVSPSPNALPQSTPLQSGSCPPPNAHSEAESIDVQVYYWCTGFSYLRDGLPATDQHQLKVRLGLQNTTNAPINISTQNPSAVRLIIREADVAARWHAPPATFEAGDRPVRVIIDNETFWAVPPNLPGDFIYGIDGGLTFASYWDNPSELGPEESIGSPLLGGGVVASERGAIDTDLVFEVPGGYGSATDTYGIGVFDVTDGLDDSERWRLLGSCKMIDQCMNASNQMPSNRF